MSEAPPPYAAATPRGPSLCACTLLQGLGAQHGLEMALSLDNTIVKEVLLYLECFWTTLTQWTTAGMRLEREATQPFLAALPLPAPCQLSLPVPTTNHLSPCP